MIVTERGLRYRETIDLLTGAGYRSIGRPRIKRQQMLAILTMAVNQIAWITDRVPIRVYQCLLVKFCNIARGVVACPSRQGQSRAVGRQDGDDLHVFCPCCGVDLLSAGPLEPSEIASSMSKTAAMRGQFPQMSPHSSDDEGKNSPVKREGKARKGKVAWVEGTGGGDPTGRG